MASKGIIKIPFEVYDKLWKHGEIGLDSIALYNFLQYTAIWQNEKFGINNRPVATRSYCKKGLHWGTDRYLEANKLLKAEGLKRTRMAKKNGISKGVFTELPFINNSEKTSTEDITRKDLHRGKSSTGTPNTDSSLYLNTDISFRKTEKTEFSSEDTHRESAGIKEETTARFSNLPHIEPSLSWEDYKEKVAFAFSEAEQIKISNEATPQLGDFVKPNRVRNLQPKFNNHLEAMLSSGEKLPSHRGGYIARFRNYLINGHKLDETFNKKIRDTRWGGSEQW